MRKQYLPQIQFKKDEGTSKWTNATVYLTGTKRYADTLEEAEAALAYVKKTFNEGARTERNDVGGFGVSTYIDEKTAEAMQIVKTRIKVREVTEWEEV